MQRYVGSRAGLERCRFFFSSRRRHTRCSRDWSSDVCSSDLTRQSTPAPPANAGVPSAAEKTGDFGEFCAQNGGTYSSAGRCSAASGQLWDPYTRSEEHTSELQSRLHLVCRLLLEKKKRLHSGYREGALHVLEACLRVLDIEPDLDKYLRVQCFYAV